MPNTDHLLDLSVMFPEPHETKRETVQPVLLLLQRRLLQLACRYSSSDMSRCLGYLPLLLFVLALVADLSQHAIVCVVSPAGRDMREQLMGQNLQASTLNPKTLKP